jgi:uncharacterized protein (DUF1684 family)
VFAWLMVALALVSAETVTPAYRAEIAKHRQERIDELKAPNGWLAVQGLYWLHEGANTAGSAAGSDVRLPARAAKQVGVFTLQAGAVTFTAAEGVAVTAGDKAVTTFAFEPRGGERSAITTAGLTLFVIRRTDRIGLRLLDPESTARRTFRGLRYFPLDPAYHVRAKFTAYPAMKTVQVPNVLGQLVPMESPGYVEFTLQGRTYRLEPVYETPRHEDLFFIFKDLTSRTDTYEAGRFLHAPLPKEGVVDLDFNRAYNPPCAFTAFATCPLPVKENQIQASIRAGELRFHLVP